VLEILIKGSYASSGIILLPQRMKVPLSIARSRSEDELASFIPRGLTTKRMCCLDRVRF